MLCVVHRGRRWRFGGLRQLVLVAEDPVAEEEGDREQNGRKGAW
jgi:hypothetical protein